MAGVLIVEDDADSREMLAKSLQRAGYQTRVATNGREALGALIADTPNVIILDYRMPEMDGISFLEVIRCYLRWQTIPVILLTAYAEGQHIQKAAKLQVDRIFAKSNLDLAEITAQVEASISGKSRPPQTDSSASATNIKWH